jgi:hypothetical protein
MNTRLVENELEYYYSITDLKSSYQDMISSTSLVENCIRYFYENESSENDFYHLDLYSENFIDHLDKKFQIERTLSKISKKYQIILFSMYGVPDNFYSENLRKVFGNLTGPAFCTKLCSKTKLEKLCSDYLNGLQNDLLMKVKLTADKDKEKAIQSYLKNQ